jgi:hypothetical protein
MRTKLPILILCAALNGWVSPPMAHSQPKSPSWSGERAATGNSESIPNPFPCLDSSKECVEQLTERAIANSSKLKTLDDRIALIDRRLGVSKDSIDYANSKLWTNYLPSSTSFGGSVIDIINPFVWIKNLAGGGEMQRDQLAIADLEVKAATLEAAWAELERQREEEKVLLGEKVLRLLLDYEAVSRKYALVREASPPLRGSQLKTYNQQQAILRIRYHLGGGDGGVFGVLG